MVASISQSLRRAVFDSCTSITAAVLNVFLFMILTFHCEPHQNKKQPHTHTHTQGHTFTPGLVYVQRWLQRQGLTYIFIKLVWWSWRPSRQDYSEAKRVVVLIFAMWYWLRWFVFHFLDLCVFHKSEGIIKQKPCVL